MSLLHGPYGAWDEVLAMAVFGLALIVAVYTLAAELRARRGRPPAPLSKPPGRGKIGGN